jgi:hypothetical protein
MANNSLQMLLRDAEGKQFRFTFTDGVEMLAEVVSTSHVDADGAVVLLRVGAAAGECAWQVRLTDIRAVAAPEGSGLYPDGLHNIP